ncbi:MAG TPA: DUF3006 domain-containing protein [Proteobacteria bacterium]|nr:DUF3006 domain-containing protein [Pseudomonadota bacterium]
MRLRVVIDRIEDGQLAVLEIEGISGDFIWPVEFLPEGAHDGSILDFTIEDNPEAEASQREKMQKLQDELLERTRRMEDR